MIVCCGEALIDMIPATSDNNEAAYIPKVGGAVFNTSMALGRLGADVAFLGSISEDVFGTMILDELKNSNVDTSLCMKTSYNTTISFVTIKDSIVTYVFMDENSSNKNIDLKNVAPLKSEVNTLYIGGISLMVEPCGNEIELFINKESSNKVVFFDPNIRPSFISDKDIYITRFKNILSQTDIIKVSDEDLEWLCPNKTFEEVSNEWLNIGVNIIILTKGSEGAMVKTKNHEVSSSIKKVEVVDTVGAGDTFNAGFLSSLIKNKNFSKNNISYIESESLLESLKIANAAASISVSRAGANPPYLKEINL